MQTTTRISALPLRVDDVLSALADGELPFRWQVRIWDLNGHPIGDANSIPYPIAPEALAEDPVRGFQLDQPVASCKVVFLADQLPPDAPLKQYQRIDIDWCFLGLAPNDWPFFTGLMDEPVVHDDPVTGVRMIEVECRGFLQRIKDYPIQRFQMYAPFTVGHVGPLTGVCPRRRFKVTTVVGAGGSEKIPTALSYSVTNDAANKCIISPNANMSSPYVRGTDYTVNTGTTPPTINWINNPAEPRYYDIPVPERFGVGVFNNPQFLVLPYGREADDVFQTTIAAYNPVGPKITPSDATPYKTLLDVSQGEYLMVVSQDRVFGDWAFKQISSVDASTGEMTLASAFSGYTPRVGDLIYLCTAEFYASWEERQILDFLLYKDSAFTTAHKRASFAFKTQAGLVVPQLPKNFLGGTSDSVYINGGSLGLVRPFYYNIINGLERVIKDVLSSTSYMGALPNVITTDSGATVKPWTVHSTNGEELLRNLKEKALPPNVYFQDTPIGTVTIKPYSQATTPAWQLSHTIDLVEQQTADPLTRAVVLAKTTTSGSMQSALDGDNRAPMWYHAGYETNIRTTAPATPATRVVDGDMQLPVQQESAGSPIKVGFRIPIASPPEAYPVLQKIEVTGTGCLTLYVIQDPESVPDQRYPLAFVRVPFGGAQGTAATTSTLTIDTKDLAGVLKHDVVCDLVLQVDELDTGTIVAPTLTEVKLLAENLVAWSASLTDDASGMPSGWQPTDTTQRGTVWAQPDSTRRESFRFAPTAELKRTLILYNHSGGGGAARAQQIHRTKIIEMTAISQMEARTLAEATLDEAVRFQLQYRIKAAFVPWADIGDTVQVSAPPGRTFSDGSRAKNLLLLGISDNGREADYTFVDYN